MVTILQSGAVMNIELPVTVLLLAAWQLETALVHGARITSEHYSAVTGTTAFGTNGGRYTSAGDSNTARTLTKYVKGYSNGVAMNDFGQQRQDSSGYQTDYGNSQPRYSTSDGSSEEQQSHISAGYHHPQSGTYHYTTASENSYEAPHQGDNDKLTGNHFSHQYEQEFSGSATGAAAAADGGSSGSDGGGYYSANEFEGPSSEYQHSQEDFTTTQHQHTDVINYVPYPVVKKLHVPYSKAVQIPISHAVIIPVRKPVPIHIPITKQIQVPVEKELKIPVERLVPYPVEKPVPVPVEKHVPYTVVKYIPVKVPKPYAVKVPVVRTIIHKVKQLW